MERRGDGDTAELELMGRPEQQAVREVNAKVKVAIEGATHGMRELSLLETGHDGDISAVRTFSLHFALLEMVARGQCERSVRTSEVGRARESASEEQVSRGFCEL